ncbi:UNVERIFIED_ORG: hypothetical protein J2X79_001369 [Arthrobacter globiformis]|nr:hypothetical protein [Arthrobacter globiformis]
MRVTPRIATGTGVDMAIEPRWDPEQLITEPDHARGDG